MELRIGDYVRTKKGTIYQFNSTSSKALSGAKKYMVKSSPNIIDLIQIGDYVNGERINEISESGKVLFYWDYDKIRSIENGSIKSIVTKEQFESMEYKVKE